MAKIRYLQMKDDTQRSICMTLHEHNGMVMQQLKNKSIKFLNGSGITVNNEQEVVKEVERLWSNSFCTNGK